MNFIRYVTRMQCARKIPTRVITTNTVFKSFNNFVPCCTFY